MSETTIRPVTAGDFDSWRPLWDAYNAFYGRSGPTALEEDITRQTWARFLDPMVPVHGMVAERDGALLGVVHYLFHFATNRLGPSCYLQDLYVDETARGGGIARALIERVRQAAHAAGAGRLYWQTHETNARAMRLYDQVARRTGFIVYAMEP